ncbi:Os05g0155250 [Oryza sativa Japonica Group]|uniref:Os05g0155250 protein n=1 Tax=Oryza sativa subsp. japonica TaxID=39947 RepID=A0A0P0WI42_ORYSJ|nr:hypothetical protein EE612_027201 [Oryza sativa]BAS92354.1 Os05g0155250 [Oryza sativa Japonica Group]
MVCLSSVLLISWVSMWTCLPVSSCVLIIPISLSSSSALSFRNLSLNFTFNKSGIICTSIKAVMHETTAVAAFATVSTTAIVLVYMAKVHKFIRWVAPQRTMNAPNCISTHR